MDSIFQRIIFPAARLALCICFALSVISPSKAAASDAISKKENNYRAVQNCLAKGETSRQVLTPEGHFVTVFNSKVATWVQRRWSLQDIRNIREYLAPSLYIPLTQQGFAQAADRSVAKNSKKKDDTNYDAVWVRDSMWIYQALKIDRPKDARRILLAIWDYYASADQLARFDDCIANPAHALDQMAVPHIRFNGASTTFADVMVHGKPQVWNHRQNDAHGLFLLSLADAIQSGLVTEHDLSSTRSHALARFPAFFTAIDFSTYEDAGAWEEIPRRNTSSIGLVTNSMQVWKGLLYGKGQNGGSGTFATRFRAQLAGMPQALNKAWSEASLDTLAALGLARVKRQLYLGGESPDYSPYDVHFRRADAHC